MADSAPASDSAPSSAAAAASAGEPAAAAATSPSAASSQAPAPAQAQKGSEPASASQPVAEPTEPLFTLPDDFRPPEGMLSRFSQTVKGKWADGRLSMSPQDVANLYVDMAREANASWQSEVKATDERNKAYCEQHFSAEQLAAAESAVGRFAESDPGFRDDFAKRQLNDPRFVNLMRIVGELLEEDTHEPAGLPSAPLADTRPVRVRAQEKLYGAGKQ